MTAARRPVLIVALLALLALAILLAARARYDVDVPLADQAIEDDVPVILVHGYGGGPGSMALLERLLEARNRQVIAVSLPDGGRGDIAASSRVLDGVMDREGVPEVDIVGFSAGGLVARTVLEQGGDDGSVRSLVFLGTPHHGTRLAGLATSLDPSLCARACREMIPGSHFLRALNSGRNTPTGTSLTNIYSADDGVVTPPRSARLEGARNILIQDGCPGSRVAHTRLVTDPSALGLVVGALDGELGELTSGSCDDVRRLGMSSES